MSQPEISIRSISILYMRLIKMMSLFYFSYPILSIDKWHTHTYITDPFIKKRRKKHDWADKKQFLKTIILYYPA